jgi:hypothetical protein
MRHVILNFALGTDSGQLHLLHCSARWLVDMNDTTDRHNPNRAAVKFVPIHSLAKYKGSSVVKADCPHCMEMAGEGGSSGFGGGHGGGHGDGCEQGRVGTETGGDWGVPPTLLTKKHVHKLLLPSFTRNYTTYDDVNYRPPGLAPPEGANGADGEDGEDTGGYGWEEHDTGNAGGGDGGEGGLNEARLALDNHGFAQDMHRESIRIHLLLRRMASDTETGRIDVDGFFQYVRFSTQV